MRLSETKHVSLKNQEAPPALCSISGLSVFFIFFSFLHGGQTLCTTWEGQNRTSVKLCR